MSDFLDRIMTDIAVLQTLLHYHPLLYVPVALVIDRAVKLTFPFVIHLAIFVWVVALTPIWGLIKLRERNNIR